MTDFWDMTEDEVVRAAIAARAKSSQARDSYVAELGRACANLHARGWTWEQVGKEMGVSLTTAYRWARPYVQ